MDAICIGLVGIGTVGGGVVSLFRETQDYLRNTLGLPVVLKRIADKNTALFPDIDARDAICSGNAQDILDDPDISVVIELVGGTTFAKDLVLSALKKGKHVITANKALIAEHGPLIFETAERHNASVHFEASVGGGMPVIKAIQESLVANDITSVKTIINGTCNYILTEMSERGLQFETALKRAQKNGYAEADPSLDIGGGDSGHKVAIMASLIHDGYVPYDRISIEGITGITKDDIVFAASMGYCIKLLGIIKKGPGENQIDVRVHPAMLHKSHILASVKDVFNAVLLEGHAVGPILLYGRGAGRMPTASAVMSDVVDVARNIAGKTPRRIPMGYYRQSNELPIKPLDAIVSRYYLCFWVVDKPKVLATIAAELGNHNISIASVRQNESEDEGSVPVVFLTHDALEKDVRNAVGEIEKLDIVKKKTHVIRIVGQTY